MPATAEPSGSPRDYASLYAPPAQRDLMQALFALEDEIGGAARVGLDHNVAHVRLKWWHEECARAAAGAALHPLTRAVYGQCRAGGGIDLSGLIEVTRWDLAAAPFEGRGQLAGYVGRWASAITQPLACCAVLPADRSVASSFGARLGAALRELELLVDLDHEARQGRLRVPLDELSDAGIDPGSLARPPWPPRLGDLLAGRHSRLRAELAACSALVSAAQQPALRGLLVWSALADRESMRASRALPHALRVTGASRLADAWQGWRTARRAAAGRLALQPEGSH